MNIVKRLRRKPESILKKGYEEEHEWILKIKMSRMRKRINIEKWLRKELESILKKDRKGNRIGNDKILGRKPESILRKG